MGDMASGGAPRTKNIVERLTEIAGAISNGQMSTSLRDGTGSEIGTPSNPLIVDIGGEVPDTLDLARVAGAATAVGAGVANPGTIRVVNASDDVNLSGILAQLDITLSALRDALRGTGSKDFTTLEADAESILAQLDVDLSTRASEATLAAQLDITQSALRDALRGTGSKDLTSLEAAVDSVLARLDVALSTRASEATLATQLDITLSALRDALRGTGSKDFTTLEADAESILAQLDVDLSTRASEATLAAQLDITQSALRDAVLGASGNDLTTLQAALDAIALDAVSLPEIKVATEATRTSVEALTADVAALKSRANKAATPVVTVATGSGAVAMSYAPGVAFWLDNVTVHFSVAPTTAGKLNVTMGAADGAVYDVVLLSIDPSATAATDICHIPIHPHLCEAGDQIRVEYANADLVTYGARIVTREA